MLREFEKSVVTLLVMSIFSDFLGALRACADFRDSTEDSRIIQMREPKRRPMAVSSI